MKLVDRKELVEATNGKLTFYTIGDLTRKKQMPFILIGKRRYLYDLDVIMEWLNNLGAQSMESQNNRLKIAGK